MNADELAAIRRRLDAATPGPWHGVGDKVRATAADALIEDNILIANAPADLAALLDDAERLNQVREFHHGWGDQETDILDVLDLWEQLGRLLGVNP